MSFVNDVMAEEADRKGLILFEDYSTIRDVDFPPVHEKGIARIKTWWNFLLVIIVLCTAIYLIDELPVRHKTAELVNVVDLSEPVMVAPERYTQPVIEQGSFVEETIEVVETRVPVLIKETIVQESPAEIKLKVAETQFAQLSINESDQVLDLTDGNVVFKKKLLTEPKQNTVEIKYNHAQLLLQKGEIELAIAELTELLSLDEHHLNIRLLLASTLIENDQIQKATEIYKKGLLVAPGEPRIAQPLARLLVEHGDAEQSLKILQESAPSLKNDPEYHSFIAALQQQSGRHNNAITIYQKILNIQPENGKWWLGFGISLMAEARNKEAISAFEWSIRDERVSLALKQFAHQRIKDLNMDNREGRL